MGNDREAGQTEITRLTRLLNADGGVLAPGYARKMNYIYNRTAIKAPFYALKEWDFYQISCGGGWILQMTVGHVSYMASFSSALFNIYTGERREITRMVPLPLRTIPMDINPELPNVVGASGKDYRFMFQTGKKVRQLTLEASDKTVGEIAVSVRLANDPENEKMVIATPFENSNQFYLNYKENYYAATGYVQFGKLDIRLAKGATAVLDWGRGVWPFRQEWYWGNGTGFAEGKPFGFNIGWGFGDLSHATENMFFYDKKAYKLGRLLVDGDCINWRKPRHFMSEDGSFDLTMMPIFDNATQTKLAFVDNSCHQVFGSYSGQVVLPDGKTVKVEELVAFCEHAVNRW